MGQAAVELTDPLENLGPASGENSVAAQSADDLLSQLAGDEIDRLLAESGDEPEAKTYAVPPIPQPQAVAPVLKKSPLEEEMDLDAALERVAVGNININTASNDSGPHIELGDAAARLPLFLRPLEWLSAPLESWPDELRDLLGKIGLITLVNAVAVIAYVLIFRRHH